MATQKEIQQVITELKEFSINKEGNTLENLTRHNFFLIAFTISFHPQDEKELYDESCRMNNLIYTYCLKNNKQHYQALTILLENELNRRQSKPIVGIKFPKFIEKTKVINKLLECCNFLLHDTPNFVQPHLTKNYGLAKTIARETIDKALLKAYETIYYNNISP
jgi:hypothetical protein